ncbi:MAG: Serine--glyoxylate transaminase [Leptospirillum sp. Group II 'C75']|jgi:aspartate aminotransferase-like enzyme|uniref:Serine-pyruvate aminotransferase n=1 Tax=Leptospirillum ferriphilum (strain ML-04) TaxID=1048260 RepID=J9ZAM1_LEPFM|nr:MULTISPECIES: alanine--glyoxylate aminotransferase family protein [Leptospirillum]AFS53590.1 serine-pyruvate aminotransferase [Leptospirillum ferriphilum ML-04]AKS23442.1 class V aminotransferase [Leptospirillum sp. Group II 'CF-1']EAY55805.1 MAG: aminotransferase, class V [Leptospirillum rubarum]EIJ75472.1 MAG: Serine--glyoxylate transaminase [Leptospirillum sp. Group II 'C75']
MKKQYLLAPGPTPVPPEVLLAMAKPIIHHRSPDFIPVIQQVRADLKWLFQTSQEVLTVAGSGTAGMEASISNFMSPGDKIIAINGGKFGERWLKIAQAFGVVPIEVKVEWGNSVDVSVVADLLAKDPSIRGVYVQASETSTGVAHDIQKLAALTRERENTILVVDAITALGVINLPMDAWGIDVLITGSQKALMIPPGLAFIGVSEKAWKLQTTAKCPRFYLDLKREKDNLLKDSNAWTPAVTLWIGLAESLKLMRAEGLDKIFARHARLAQATREGVRGFGLEVFAKNIPSDAVTAVVSPQGIDGQAVYKNLREQYGITAAGGQDQLKGKVFRLSHMGYADVFDVITAVSGVEMVLTRLGYKEKPLGSGVARAQSILIKE